MALTVLGVCPRRRDLDVRILATDIDPNVLAHGRAGRLSARRGRAEVPRQAARNAGSQRAGRRRRSRRMAPELRAPGRVQRAEPDRRLADDRAPSTPSSAATW